MQGTEVQPGSRGRRGAALGGAWEGSSGAAWAPSGNADLAAAGFVVLGELLFLGCSLRQKIAFFRKVLGDFLFGKFRSVLLKAGEGVFSLQFLKGCWFSKALHLGFRMFTEAKPRILPPPVSCGG